MAVNQTQATQSPVYVEQGGKIYHWDTGTRYEINGVPMGLAVKYIIAAGAANLCNVGIQIQDLAGNNCLTVFDIAVWLSDSPAGANLAAHVPTGGVAVLAPTTQVLSKVTNLALEILTNAAGLAAIAITDTAKTAYYVCTEIPGTGLVAVSPQLITANYG